MLPYSLIFLYSLYKSLSSSIYTKCSKTESFFFILILTVFIGTRYQVGPDWDQYFIYLDSSADMNLFQIFTEKDPFFILINWFFAKSEYGIYLVNSVCAFIFSFSIVKFCQTLPNFWLALNLATPYLIFVVGMGYNRQAVSLSLVMYGFTFLQKRQFIYYLVTLISSFGFHASSLINSFFVLFAIRSKYLLNKFIYFLVIITTGYFAFDIFYSRSVSDLFYLYFIWDGYQSAGVFVRLLTYLIPAIIFLLCRKRFDVSPFLVTQLTIQSILAIILFIVNLQFPLLSTPIDRISLYLIPLQITVLSYLVKIRLFNFSPKFIKIILLLYSSLIYIVWFNLGNHAEFWLPYKTILFNY